MHPALKCVDHRPWPLPAGPWVMLQVWHDLLFAHWPIAHAALRPLVPPQLSLDTWEGECWVGVVPFWMSGVRARGMPAIPVLSRFPELNVRTYVNYGNKPGVYFFSLDAGSHLAVRGARAFYHLPYFYAEMKADDVGNEIEYRSSRRGAHAEFRGRYGPSTPRKLRSPGTLEHWLTERYCLYTVHHGNLYRGEVHHARWPLQDASAEIQTNTMANAAGIRLPDTKPLLHFSKRQDVLVWPLEKVSLWVCSAGILPAVAGETPARQPPGPFGKLRAGWRRYIGWGVRRSNRGSFGMEWAARIILRFFSRKFLFLRSCE